MCIFLKNTKKTQKKLFFNEKEFEFINIMW